MEEGRVRQGHTKGRGTQDGETEEEIERERNGKNKRWKRGWKDGSWDLGGMGESKAKKKKQEAIYVGLDGRTAPTPRFTAL